VVVNPAHVMGLEGLPSVIAMVVGLLFAAVGRSLARGPASAHLKWYARASLAAAVFGASNSHLGFDMPDRVRVAFSMVALAVAPFFGVAWMLYLVGEEGRRFSRAERIFAVVVIAAGGLCLVPGLAVRPAVQARQAWGGLVYRDGVPTRVGELFGLLFLLLMAWSTWRAVEFLRAGRAGGWALFAGSALALSAGINDSLAFAQQVRTPYLLDLSFLALVIVAGTRLSDRFVDNARDLQAATHQLQEAQAELVKRERLAALGELSATVAHEVRTPVAVMFNVLPALRRELSTRAEGSLPLLKLVEEEADRLRRLVDDLLDFVRPLSPRPVKALLADIVEDAVTAARAAHEDARGAEVKVEGDGGDLVCDPQLLHRALSNLMGNAFEAGSQQVAVRWRGEAGRVHLEIVDHGRGVKPGDEVKLFRPFFTTRPSGTGLGLSVVQRIIEAHGGRIAYAPTPGGGATFSFSLPRDRAEAA